MDNQKCTECKNEERIRALETGAAETRIYMKQIKEDMGEIKTDIKDIKEIRHEKTKWYETDLAKYSIKALWILLIGMVLLIAGKDILDIMKIIPK